MEINCNAHSKVEYVGLAPIPSCIVKQRELQSCIGGEDTRLLVMVLNNPISCMVLGESFTSINPSCFVC